MVIDDKIDKINISICEKYNTIQRKVCGVKYCYYNLERCKYLSDTKIQIFENKEFKLYNLCLRIDN